MKGISMQFHPAAPAFLRTARRSPRRSLLAQACALLVLPLAAQSALAQDAAPATTRPSATALDAVTVTAERREQNLQDVPVSVGVVQGEALRSYTEGADDTLLALSGRVPSFYAETTTGRIFPRFYIRGLGNIDFYLGASQPVSIIQDDVVLEHVVLKSNPVYDVDQVEVLRGPQGSLFGRNTTAGIVKFDTAKPSQDPSGRVNVSYGSYNTVSIDGGMGGAINDVLSYRVSTLYQHRDDWVDNPYRGPSADGTVSPKNDTMGGYNDRNLPRSAPTSLPPATAAVIPTVARRRITRSTACPTATVSRWARYRIWTSSPRSCGWPPTPPIHGRGRWVRSTLTAAIPPISTSAPGFWILPRTIPTTGCACATSIRPGRALAR